jgi:hypothetical protein
MVANSSNISLSRYRTLSSGSLLAKVSLAESSHAVLGASDCEGLPPQNRKKQDSHEQASQQAEPLLIEDIVEVSAEVSALSAEALSQVATPTETAILAPSSILKQAYRVQTPLKPQGADLEDNLAQSNWSVYSAKLML